MPGDAASLKIAQMEADNRLAIANGAQGIDMIRARAGANYDNARAGLLGPQFAEEQRMNAAKIGQMGIENAHTNALTADTQSHTRYRDKVQFDMGLADIGYKNSMTDQNKAATAGQRTQNRILDQTFSSGEYRPGGDGYGWKRGMTRVPGKGSPKKDSVKAKLAPGEAVLNAPAAEMAGRDTIAALNRRGAAQMGMSPGQGNMPGHYATGTAMVEGPANSMPMAGHQLPDLNIQSEYQPLPVDFAPAGYTEGSMGPTPHAPSPLFGPFSPAGYTPGSMAPTPRAFAPAGYTPGHMTPNRQSPIREGNPSPGYTPGSMSGTPRTPINMGNPRPGYTGGGMRANRPSPIQMGNPSPGYTPGSMGGSIPAGRTPQPPMVDPNAAWGNRPAAPPAPPAPPAATGWADPGQINYGAAPAPAPAPRSGSGMQPFNMPAGVAMAGQGGHSMPNFNPPAPLGGGRGGGMLGGMSNEVMAGPSAPRPNLGVERARSGSFGEAFRAARQSAGGSGGMFNWKGKDYQTNVRGEAYQPQGKLTRV